MNTKVTLKTLASQTFWHTQETSCSSCCIVSGWNTFSHRILCVADLHRKTKLQSSDLLESARHHNRPLQYQFIRSTSVSMSTTGAEDPNESPSLGISFVSQLVVMYPRTALLSWAPVVSLKVAEETIACVGCGCVWMRGKVGDTVYNLARDFTLTSERIAWSNPVWKPIFWTVGSLHDPRVLSFGTLPRCSARTPCWNWRPKPSRCTQLQQRIAPCTLWGTWQLFGSRHADKLYWSPATEKKTLLPGCGLWLAN